MNNNLARNLRVIARHLSSTLGFGKKHSAALKVLRQSFDNNTNVHVIELKLFIKHPVDAQPEKRPFKESSNSFPAIRRLISDKH